MLRKLLVTSLLIVLVLFLTLAISTTPQDSEPPQVYIEVSEQVPADMPFELKLSASEPVTYAISYAGLELSEVAQDYTLSLLAVEGAQSLDIRAMDSSGNQSSYQFGIYGIAGLKPTLSLAEWVKAGNPFSMKLSWPAEGLQPSEIAVYLDSKKQTLYQNATEAIALAAIPLGSSAQHLPVQVIVKDSFGRTVILNKSIEVLADEQVVENLNLSPSTFSVVTAEAQDRERQALEQAYASAGLRPHPLWQDVFLMPIEGRLTSGYGIPRRYIAGGNISFHTGADIAAPQGTPIQASNDGIVMIANYYPIKGGLVVIDHGARVFSFYFHQSKLHVDVGEMVKRGHIIGEVGSTGLSTGPHLHWEMHINGVATNPLSWVDRVLP